MPVQSSPVAVTFEHYLRQDGAIIARFFDQSKHGENLAARATIAKFLIRSGPNEYLIGDMKT